MQRLLILQGSFAEYRRPVFDALADHYRVTVAHGGAPAARPGDRFAEHLLPLRHIGPFHFPSLRKLRELVAGSDAVITMFDLGWPAYFLPSLSGGGGTRWILWGHRYGARPLANRVRDAIMRRADALLMYGWEHIDQMVAAGIDRQRIFVAPNTMAVPNHQDFSSAAKDSFLFVGRLQERKRLPEALEAFAAIRAPAAQPLWFDIVGGGAIEGELRAHADRLGIADRVRFHGAITDDEALAGFFRRAIAYVSPGPVGLSVLHSFAYGVPVLTLRHGGYHGPEFHNLRHGENGLIADDMAAFTAYMQRLLDEPEAAASMGSAAYRLYAGSRTVAAMIDGIRSAVENRDIGTHRRD
ncbi:MAG: glycosyltransferase family 4 protein [Sphingopyxis sp.]|nr:glycosyltransferase family 4 protein [Sphingopyxis sp.]